MADRNADERCRTTLLDEYAEGIRSGWTGTELYHLIVENPPTPVGRERGRRPAAVGSEGSTTDRNRMGRPDRGHHRAPDR